jgi:hypothetical protein
MKDQIIRSEDNLEDKLTKGSKTVSGDLVELVLSEWMSRLKWIIGHKV